MTAAGRRPVIVVRDWPTCAAALGAARRDGAAPRLVTPPGAASTLGAGYLAALQARAERAFPDVDFELIVY